MHGPYLLFILAAAIGFIILMTSKVNMNAFLVLLFASFGTGLASGMAPGAVVATITDGFGNILGKIGIVIICGTIIGTMLEKTGATVTMANAVLDLIGKTRSALAMSVTGAVVSISVFCDSGFVILSALNRTLAKKAGLSMTTMAIALASGLYATHTFVPPTPGPIAAAGNLGADIGLVILFGLIVSVPAVAAGYLWAVKGASRYYVEPAVPPPAVAIDTPLPGKMKSFAPIIVPILLITGKSIAGLPAHPFGDGMMKVFLDFFGDPTTALIAGVLISFFLLPGLSGDYLNGWVNEGLKNAAAIVMITGAGGAFGAILKATEIGGFLSESLARFHLGIFLPCIIAAALKTAQGSSTVALITTSALIAPMLSDLGLSSEAGKALAVMATGSGAMIMSHANDSYFWVVSQFSGLDAATAYKTHSIATLIQGLTSILFIFLLSLVIV